MASGSFGNSGGLQVQVMDLLEQQLHDWDLARNNYLGLERVMRRPLDTPEGADFYVQFNPARIRSSAAKVDARSISERPCFLCEKHLPVQQQWVEFGKEYLILVNPYPIFTRHLTIPVRAHEDQLIAGRMGDMLQLAKSLEDFVIFYNGPRCGASAPDHFHFQAGNKGFLPIEQMPPQPGTLLQQHDRFEMHAMEHHHRRTILMRGNDGQALADGFEQIVSYMKPLQPDQPEPMLNILARWESPEWIVLVLPRKVHRPWQFHARGDDQVMLSPASVDLGGVLVTPRETDYHRMDLALMEDIFGQVCIGDVGWEGMLNELSNK